MKDFFTRFCRFFNLREKWQRMRAKQVLDYYVNNGRYSQDEADKMFRALFPQQSKRTSN